MRKLLLILALFSPTLLPAQTPARFDLPVLTTTPATTPPGNQPPLYAVINAKVNVCGYPATMSGGVCTNKVTTYTDSTLSTACPSTAQLTAPGTSACISTTGLQGALGFWYDSSAQTHMTYTISTSWGNFGPYDIDQSGGANLQVSTNSTPNASQSALNFSNTTPAAPAGYTNVLWQNSGGNESAYVATATGGGVTTFGNDYSLVGAFTDSSGNVLKAISISTTSQVSFSAPVGTTQLQLGVSDDVMGDNTGSWTVAVNGSNYTVLGTATPWTNAGGINSQYPIGTSGATAATVIPIANVNLPVTIQYVSGTVASSSHSQCGTVHAITVDTSGVAGCVVTFGSLVSPFYLPTYWTVSAPSPSGGGSTLAEGAPAVGNSSNQVSASPYELFPHVLDNGAGTEASPWTNATDNNAGIQTQVNALSARGGRIDLPGGRYDILTPITLGTHYGQQLNGFVGAQNNEPDAATEGTYGTKLRLDPSLSSGGNVLDIGVVGGSYSNRFTGIRASHLYLWGNTSTIPATEENNAAIYINGWVDAPWLYDMNVGNFGVGYELGSASGQTDAGFFDHLGCISVGVCFVFKMNAANSYGCWYCSLTNSGGADSNFQGITAFGNGGTPAGSALAGDVMNVFNVGFTRDCGSSACAALTGGQNANIYWERWNSNLSNLNSTQAGYNITSATWFDANGITLAGSYDNLHGSRIVGQQQAGTAGVPVYGSHNYIHGNMFADNSLDISVQSGAADNYIYQPGATVSDAGIRTVINGVSLNAGDPNTTGNWSGVAKWAGLIINDTTNNVVWLYTSPSARIQLNSTGGVTWPATGDLVVSNSTSSPTGVAPVNGDCVIGSGGAWVAGSCSGGGSIYPLGGWTALNITGWTWINQGSATATVSNGILFVANTGNNADNIHFIGTTLPATPWTVIAALIPSQGPGFPAYQTQWSDGLTLSDGTKLTSFNVGVGPTAALANSVSISNYTNATTFSANAYTGTPAQFPLVLWERIQDNGTTRTYSFSSDPANLGWTQVYSEAHAGFLTPTQVGIAANYFGNSNTFTGYPWVSFQVTTP